MTNENPSFLVYRASAGAGKTYTLVKHYLKLAFDEHNGQQPKERFRHILAITFTNKAANEMKERILKYLDEIVDKGEESGMASDLCKEMGISLVELQIKAKSLHTAIIHNYSDFSVCTIDSFMYRVVRTFAHDLDLPMNFNVQIEEKELIQNSVDRLLLQAGTEEGKELTEVLKEFALSRMETGKSFNTIEESLKQAATQLFSEEAPSYLSKLKNISFKQFIEIHKRLGAAIKEIEDSYISNAGKVIAKAKSLGLDQSDFKTGTYALFQKVSEKDFSPLGGDNKTLRSGVVFKKGYEKDAAKVEMNEFMASAFEEMDQATSKYNTLRLLDAKIFEMALLNRMNQYVLEYARENELVHISEFNKRIGEVVDNEPMPFVFERLGSRYSNYLIDEFQDTSRLQWGNLLPLLENGVAEQNLSLVVGDGKQAIYRFRQGDVKQFINLPKVDSPQHGAIFTQPGMSEIVPLESNFRTAETVVRFNNDFFQWQMQHQYDHNPDLQNIYEGGEQIPKKKGGYVELLFTQKNSEFPEALLKTITTLVEEKGYQLRDITLLADKNGTLSNMAQFLSEQTVGGKPVNVVSNESFLLKNSKTVMFVRALMQYLIDGEDKMTVSSVLQRWSDLGLLKENYYELMLQPTMPSLHKIFERNHIVFSSDMLVSLPLIDCIETLVRLFHLEGMENHYMAAFLNKAHHYSKLHRQDISEFCEWFDDNIDKLYAGTDSSTDAIRLMTVHSAKGLEAPVVIYVLPKPKTHASQLWIDLKETEGALDAFLPISHVELSQKSHTEFDSLRDQEERRKEMDDVNRLYVALTRPKDKLFVLTEYKENAKTAKEKSSSFNEQIHLYASQAEHHFSNSYDELQPRTEMNKEGEIEETTPVVERYWIGKYLTKKEQEALNEDKSKPGERQETKTTKAVSIDNLSYPRWEDRLVIASHSEDLFNELEKEPIRRGNIIHQILAMIPCRGCETQALEKYALHNGLSDEEKAHLLEEIKSVVYGDETTRFFSPEDKALCETPLIYQGQELRPDRIVFGKDGVSIIDYKTGHFDGQENLSYTLQVQRYCTALASMGYKNVEGYLLYIGEQTSLVKVR
ncbi:MAG: UvrD-helicase domain-containing protein [Bacteroidales bacterium]|nr:UvrD-helicase domain-containing protein [Bacteroidales bacterium]